MVLLAWIDDATSRVLARFYEADTTRGYMDLLGRYMRKYGRPLSVYTDRGGVFVGKAKDASGESRHVATQFSRALGELNIELILAYSPQAKGRIERFFQTAQDRLVKELTLPKARTLAEANTLVEEVFVPLLNRRFTVAAQSAVDVHRPVERGLELASILSHRETRVIGQDYTFRYGNRVYQIPAPALAGMRGGRVVIEERLSGERIFRFRQHRLACTVVPEVRPTTEGVGALPPAPRSLAPAHPPAECAPPQKASGQAIPVARVQRR